MWKVTRTGEYCIGHRLMNYTGPCAKCHGHNFFISVSVIYDKLDSRGMVLDFGELKDIMNGLLMKWDHGMVLHINDPFVKVFRKYKQKVYILPGNPTSEVMAEYIHDDLLPKVRRILNTSEVRIQVSVRETENSVATYPATL